MAKSRFELYKVLESFEKTVRVEMPTLLANQARNFFLDSFKNQAWDGKGWAPRQKNTRKGRAILVKSGALRRAVSQSVRSVAFERISLVVALPYAAVHNEGFDGTVRAHQRKRFSRSSTSKFIGLRRDNSGRYPKRNPLKASTFAAGGTTEVRAHRRHVPQRKYMGDSAALRDKQMKLILKQVDKIWQG